MQVRVQVQQDHLERLVNRRSPVTALAELVWNAVDGDATRVDVRLVKNSLDGVEEIHVQDNGHGIEHQQATTTFGKLGDSWKRRTRQSPGGRELHGRAGEGRFAAFALGGRVRWKTRGPSTKGVQQFEIVGKRSDLGSFDITDPTPTDRESGTDVVVGGIERNPTSLLADGAADRFAEILALYLRAYPIVTIKYDGVTLDPKSAEERVAEIDMREITTKDGGVLRSSLTIIEWKRRVERALHFCDGKGFSLSAKPVGVQAPGFEFTAYLKSDRFRDWDEEGLFELDELHPDVDAVLRAARDAMRDYFRERRALDAKATVERWKEEHVYPYQGLPQDVIEEAERQVFDVVALNINEYLPTFSETDSRSKQLSFRMLRAAIESSPEHAKQIMQEVLDLPTDKQEELATLLERTKLSSIVTAAKLVGDRLEVLAGLEAIIFDPESKRKVKERQHLQRLLAEHTWIFGEEFNLSVDDQSLDEVLRKHLGLLGKDRTDLAPVTTLDGDIGIVDLMCSRKIPQPQPEEREHLIVELKRPSKKLDSDALSQIEKYAFAVSGDERFRDTNTRWIFWLVSNDMTEHVRHKVTRQADRPDGLHHRSEELRLSIWVKSWGQILDAAKGRLRFFQDHLKYEATHDTGLAYLRKTHDKYLPKDPMAETEEPDV